MGAQFPQELNSAAVRKLEPGRRVRADVFLFSWRFEFGILRFYKLPIR
jgi:hypothetical protein